MRLVYGTACFLQREQAEGELNSLYSQQGYSLLLLRIIEMHSSGPAEPDVSIRQAAAVNFKVRAFAQDNGAVDYGAVVLRPVCRVSWSCVA